MLWASPFCYEAVVTASGPIVYRRAPLTIRRPMRMEGELAKSVAQTAAKAAASEQFRSEDLWAL